jgi:hypothetical protein
MTIWMLESQAEESYSYSLSEWIQEVIDNPSDDAIASIRTLWDNESWESIVSRFNTEGSVWYVWWMDGVRTYMQLDVGSDEEM